MKKTSGLATALLLTGAATLVVVPLLMVMVLMGGSADLGDVCAPGSDSLVLAAGAADEALDDNQLANASTIVSEGLRLAVPRRAIVVALTVAHQESGFRNYANDGLGHDLAPDQQGIGRSLDLPHEAVGSDHGSLGVFQQQWPWWGTMPELMDPASSAEKFYTRLLAVPGWERMSIGAAGQQVQKSAHPEAYADDVPLAQAIVHGAPAEAGSPQTAAYFGATAGGGCAATAAFSGDVVFPLAPWAHYVDLQNWGHSGSHWDSAHTGTDLSTACGTPVLAATSGVVTVRTDQAWAGNWLVEISTGAGNVETWYAHMQAISVATGDHVSAGQGIGEVGDLGNATGCHLHFEVHPNGGSTTVDPTIWLHDNVGHGSVVLPVDHGNGSSGMYDVVTVLTGNVPFTLSSGRARAQISYLLAQQPDVLLLQEVTSRNVPEIVSTLPGSWAVWQPPGSRGGSAIVWDTTKFLATRHGAQLGFNGARYDRWMPWVLLESDQGTLPVVGLHMPTDASKSDQMRHYFQTMTRNYQHLFSTMSDAGYPPVVGGDWNHPLDTARESWSPVPMLHRVGLITNWQAGKPCTGTSAEGGRIDGFAFNPQYLRVVDQGCLDRQASDHRPVWIALAPSG